MPEPCSLAIYGLTLAGLTTKRRRGGSNAVLAQPEIYRFVAKASAGNLKHHEGHGIRSSRVFLEMRPILYESFGGFSVANSTCTTAIFGKSFGKRRYSGQI